MGHLAQYQLCWLAVALQGFRQGEWNSKLHLVECSICAPPLHTVLKVLPVPLHQANWRCWGAWKKRQEKAVLPQVEVFAQGFHWLSKSCPGWNQGPPAGRACALLCQCYEQAWDVAGSASLSRLKCQQQAPLWDAVKWYCKSHSMAEKLGGHGWTKAISVMHHPDGSFDHNKDSCTGTNLWSSCDNKLCVLRNMLRNWT